MDEQKALRAQHLNLRNIMAPEQIPDILADKGVQKDMDLYVKSQMVLTPRQSWDKLSLSVETLIRKTYKYALAEGFRYGWNIANNRINKK